ncbi:von Willebrand factor A domain-containing protein 7-like [Melanotaenia boesemani]|uniref:von Willebrand factor A domain-containing protein 7-like n=1 Tax=Melanotaenia boesemani TaxID=1250792 RepID=UPI001C03DC1E|nr:von Willebrand factor A domain-containing protein 7-like [Melanotaenia boesemani]
MCVLAVFCLLLLQTEVQGFKILTEKSISHETITEKAILNVTAQSCRSLALAEGRDFTFPPQPFTAKSIATACAAPKSVKSFLDTINHIQSFNWITDIAHVLDSEYHFDDEMFIEGKKIITDGLDTVRSAILKNNSLLGPVLATWAKINLGVILHPLQDFYSHSNWVEMGNKLPNSNLIIAGKSIGNIAAKTRKTCRNCDGNNCRNNILEDILGEKILTSGYFSLVSSGKLPGKCSHGDFPDQTRDTEPTGGINKDTYDSSHGHLHQQAADLAVAASSELLEEIRRTAGDKKFIQMMGLTRGKPLCFVVDTTGSMGDDIAAVRTVTSSIIDSKVGTEDEPSVYILVPFNDPDFGPLQQTTDPEVFKSYINSLTPSGGGDFPEMSLSGLQLALTGAPPNSEIFLFTDATAKDDYLKDTVLALIEQTKSVVNFMITNVLGFRRRRQADNNQQQSRQMLRSDGQLYRELAQASGGQAIQVAKGQLLQAISIITTSTGSSQVTLLQASRNPGKVENFTFTVDESVSNLTIYITGSSVSFTLISPSGVPQNFDNITGSSVISSESVGNFQTVRLQAQVGVWEMRMLSTNSYGLKVVGESAIDFLFNFLKELQGPLGGFDLVDNRPPAGGNGSLMVTLTESSTATVTEVTLVETSGSGQVDGRVEAQGGGKFIVRFDRIPSSEFVILVKGQSNNSISRSSSSSFQRQSSTGLRASSLTVTAGGSSDFLEPGTTLSVPFSVTTSGAGGTFSIQATNDQSFVLSSPTTLLLETGGSANGTVNLTAPSNTPSGTGVALTIQATAPGSTDTNYALLRLTVLKRVTDFTKPVCQLLSLQANCSDNCNQSVWELSVQVTDGANGTGVSGITLRQGNGTLNTSMAAGNGNITLVNYTASCCSPDVQLVAVDGVGNEETCSFSARTTVTQAVTTSSPQTTAVTSFSDGTNATQAVTTSSPQTVAVTSFSGRVVQSVILCISITVLGLDLSSEMVIN